MDRFKFVDLDFPTQVWREGDPPLVGNDGPPVPPAEPAAPRDNWGWFCMTISVVCLLAASLLRPDGPVFWCNAVLGIAGALLFWSIAIMIRNGRQA